mgnify:CR=1 FL=1
MKNSTTTNDLAARLLDDPRLCDACRRFGSEPVTGDERRELVELGLAYQAPRRDGRAGTDTILSDMGRVAARLGRLAQVLQANREGRLDELGLA